MKYTKLFLIIYLFNIFSICSFSEEQIYFDKVINTGNINSMITQDKEGIIWIATTGGIVKYNGYDNVYITADNNSINSNLVPSIFVDSEGLIWIITLSGLNLYNKTNNQFSYYKTEISDSNSISSNSFNWAPYLIAEDKEGGIWVGSQNGLNRFDKTNNQFERYLLGKSIWSVFCDSKNNIWIATESNGLYKINAKNKSIEEISPLKSRWVYAVNEDSKGSIWIGTKYNGLYKLNPETNQIKNYTVNNSVPHSIHHNEIFSIMIDSDDKLWLGRNYKNSIGIEVFDSQTEIFTLYKHDKDVKNSLSGNTILSSFQDDSGNIWIPDNLGPVNLIDKRKPKFDSLKKINGIMSLYEDSENNIWVGTVTEGLYKITGKDIENYNESNSGVYGYVFSILEESKDKLWLGLGNGELVLFDKVQKKVVERYQNPIGNIAARSLILDNENPYTLWFGTEGYGMFKFDLLTKKFKQFLHDDLNIKSIASNQVQRLVQDEKGNIWLPTHGEGLDKFNKKTEYFTHYKHDKDNPDSISGNQGMDFFIDSKNRYFVSTDDGGLNYFDPETEKFKSFGQKHGFETNSIRNIQEDDEGFLWLTSNNGLYKFSFDDEKIIANYKAVDGLSSDQFTIFISAALKSSDGKLYFTTNQGIDIFDPKKIRINDYNPRVVITSIKQNEKAIETKAAPELIKEINLDWKNNYFEVEYVALNYTLSEKLEYMYMMEGVDKDWYYAGTKRFGRYSGLPGGKYTLRVKGTNNDGIWSDKEAIIKVNITPAFWQTKSFMALLILIGFFLIAAVYYYRLKAIEHQKKELENLVDIRTKELSSKTIELNHKNIQLTDSIHYAKRIQNVILPEIDTISSNFKEFLLIYLPRDIVSGDFYWYSENEDDIFIAAVDCTGHGVPGALLATIGNMLLNKYVNEHKMKNLNEILEEMDIEVNMLLSSHNKDKSFDGMDLSICKINKKDDSLIFTGARNPLVYFSTNDELIKIPGTKRSIGGKQRKKHFEFETNHLKLSEIKTIYMFSDGYIDQLNEDNRSMSYKKFSNIIIENKDKSLQEQKEILLERLNEYKQGQDQTDDITVMAVKL